MSKSARSSKSPALPLTKDALALLASLEPASIAALMLAALSVHEKRGRQTGRRFTEARVTTAAQRRALDVWEPQLHEGGR